MIVFHGSTDVVKNPDVNHSYRPLDFGKGFYITTVEKQAKNGLGEKQNWQTKKRNHKLLYHVKKLERLQG